METRRLPIDGKCPNLSCGNKMGEGTFALVTFPSDGGKPVQILMCTPCAETINRDFQKTNHG